MGYIEKSMELDKRKRIEKNGKLYVSKEAVAIAIALASWVFFVGVSWSQLSSARGSISDLSDRQSRLERRQTQTELGLERLSGKLSVIDTKLNNIQKALDKL